MRDRQNNFQSTAAQGSILSPRLSHNDYPESLFFQNNSIELSPKKQKLLPTSAHLRCPDNFRDELKFFQKVCLRTEPTKLLNFPSRKTDKYSKQMKNMWAGAYILLPLSGCGRTQSAGEHHGY